MRSQNPTIGEDREGPMVPEGVEKKHSEGCLVDFPTWSVSFKRKRSDRRKRINYIPTADPFWTKMILEMTPEDMVESFVINNVRVCYFT